MSSPVPLPVRVVGGGLLAAGALVAGAALGAGLERAVMRRSRSAWAPLPDPIPDRVVDFTASDGTRLHVEVDEPDPTVTDPVTVVFSHGYALSMRSWSFQRHALRGRARLVLFDQRSHGRSERATFDSHHVDRLGTDLREVIEHVAPNGPLMLVGHSMGGMTVMALAEQAPDLVRERVLGVALVSTSAGGLASLPLGLPGALGTAVTRVAPGLASLLARQKDVVEWTRKGGSDLALLLTRAYSFGSTAPTDAARFVASMVDATPIDVIAEFLPSLQVHDKREALHVFQGREVLVIVGSADRLIPVAHSEVIVRELPGAEFVVVPDAGHMVQIEFPSIVDDLLIDLLRRVQRSAAHEARRG